jgi:hypothetical protein
MLDNILSIKNGTYVDEGILIDIDDKSDKKSITPNMNTNMNMNGAIANNATLSYI